MSNLITTLQTFLSSLLPRSAEPAARPGLDTRELVELCCHRTIEEGLNLGNETILPNLLTIEVGPSKAGRLLIHRTVLEQRLPQLIAARIEKESLPPPSLVVCLKAGGPDLAQDYLITAEFRNLSVSRTTESADPVNTDTPASPQKATERSPARPEPQRISPAAARQSPPVTRQTMAEQSPSDNDFSQMKTKRERSLALNLSWVDARGRRATPIFGQTTFGRADDRGENQSEILAFPPDDDHDIAALGLRALQVAPTPGGARLMNLGTGQILAEVDGKHVPLSRGSSTELPLPVCLKWPGRSGQGFSLMLKPYNLEH